LDGLREAFASVCGQGRCFVVEGRALPVCERCLGLYVGAAATGAWVVASRVWRRGLPSRGVAWAEIAFLVLALAGGVHWVDAGPAWRMACGLWLGHVAMVWLAGGAGHLARLSHRGAAEQAPWRTRELAVGLAAGPLLGAGAWAFSRWTPGPWWLWSGLSAAGAGALGAAVAAGAAAVVAYAARARRREAAGAS